MNFDGGRGKIEVRETLFCVLAGKFHRPVGPIFFKGDDFSFFPIKILLIWKIPLNSRLIRLDQHETTFTGKNPRRNTLNIIFFAQFSCVFYRGSMVWKITWLAGSPGSSFWLSLILFGCFCLFVFCFFLLLVCFPLIPLLALRLSFTRFCDTRFSELLGMIQLLLGMARYDKLFLGMIR